jgi:pSer/pThr/pTyr-binding forkhead associated (FHA) protein
MLRHGSGESKDCRAARPAWSSSAAPTPESRFQLDQPVTSVGRHPASDIFLDDVTTSHRHAEFRRAGDGFEVVDMNSLNGISLNGQPLHSDAVLANGDEIQIGKFRLVFLAGPQ